MRFLWRIFVPLLAGLVVAWAADSKPPTKLQLRGVVEKAPWGSFISISAVGRAFGKQEFLGHGGRFKFKKLEPGTYHLIVYHPRRGEVRRTVEVTPSLADAKGRVEINLKFEISDEERARILEERSTVSVRELSVSRKAWTHFLKARNKLAADKAGDAVKNLLKAVQISPEFAIAWNELGTIAYRRAQFDQAADYFGKALDLDPDFFAPLVNLGGTLLSQARFQDALTLNEKARRLRPDDALANSQLGLNHFYLERYSEAERYLARARELDPHHFSLPQLFLAEIYIRAGERERAVGELEDFLERHPDSPRNPVIRERLAQLRQKPVETR